MTTPPTPPVTVSYRFPGGSERRSERRFAVSRPGKLFRRLTQSYAGVQTRDLSLGGALLETDIQRGFTVGEIVEVGVAYSDSPLVRSAALVPAVVVRVECLDQGRQAVAVRYVQAVAKRAA